MFSHQRAEDRVTGETTRNNIAIFLLTLVQHCLNILSDESCIHNKWCQLSGFGPVCVSPFKGKSFTEETLMATKKKAKKKKKH
jgi:hypothetical protein